LSSPSRITIGESVLISGRLTHESGVGIGGENVTLKYRVFPMTEWTDLITVTTANDGSYTYTWTPPYEGYYYEISGIYTGDAYEPSSAESTVKVAAAPEIPQYLVVASITAAIASIVAALGTIAVWYKSTKKKPHKSEERN
jgi:hypothetical protein